jgi:site-specific DNA-cytosine methylase
LRTYTAFFPFQGLGLGARGFLDAQIHMMGEPACFRSIGGIDIDPLGCADFEYLTDSPALCADISTLTVADLIAFAGAEAPDVVFMSPPCKSFSGLLSKAASESPKYNAMSRLVVTWTKLMLDAWGASPPRLVLLENVPRIASRGAWLLKEVKALLRKAGYVFHAQNHDCGELGGLAQHRQRYLLVARHPKRCAPLLYQPPKKRVRACGEVLEKLPLPEDPAGGPMHKLPRLSWINWVRLALIPAGGDWRDLEGVLADGQARREVFRRHHVGRWDESTATVAGSGSNGIQNIADPRVRDLLKVDRAYDHGYGVLRFDEPSSTVAGGSHPGQGAYSVADPRIAGGPSGSAAVAGATSAEVLGEGRQDADLLALEGPQGHAERLRPRGHEEVREADACASASVCVGAAGRAGAAGARRASRLRQPGVRSTGEGPPSPGHPRGEHGRDGCAGAFCAGVVEAEHEAQRCACPSDLRVDRAGARAGEVLRGLAADHLRHPEGADALTGDQVRFRSSYYRGTYGVIDWSEAIGTITGNARIDAGRFAVADPRRPPKDGYPVIIAADGTWHRPLTTLELWALQSGPIDVKGKPVALAGTSSSKWRERIGNAVPRYTATAIAEQMLTCLVAADANGWSLSSSGAVWVVPSEAVALS